MDKEKKMMGKIILTIPAMLMWLVAYSPKHCQAAVSMTLQGSGTWAIGTQDAGTTWPSPNSPNTWSVTNNGSSYENIGITVATSAPVGSVWAPIGDKYGNPVGGVYSLNLQPSGTRLTTSSTTLAGLPSGSTSSNFGLLLTLPSVEVGTQHTLTVTLTAAEACMDGQAKIVGACWRVAAVNGSCATACASRGGCVGVTYTPSQAYAICCNVGYPNTYTSGAGPVIYRGTNQCYYNADYNQSAGCGNWTDPWRGVCACAY